MEQMIEFALNNKIEVLGFSEHLDLECPLFGYDLKQLNIPKYVESFKKFKTINQDKIKLLCGIEFGYAQEVEHNYSDISSKYPFDFVINSTHLTDGKECYFEEYFKNKDKHFAYNRYLEQVLYSVNAKFDYQVIGHIGYVSRQAPYENTIMEYSEFKTILDEILINIIKKDKALEINTSVKKAGTPIIPNFEIIQQYRNLGGKLICFGSDAHDDFRLCENYKMATQMAKQAGFNEICYFENKEPVFLKI